MTEIIANIMNGILNIKLNRPEKKNAINASMYDAIANSINDAVKDKNIHVIVISAVGDTFSAGNDLNDFLQNPPGPGDSPQAKLMEAFINCKKPIVAAVQGSAVGSGTTMLTHCDFIYASENAKFQMPFINLALVPEFGTSFSLPRQIGYLNAAELILLGKFFDVNRALQLGLITQIVPEHLLIETAMKTAGELAKKPSSALQACKTLMKQSSEQGMKDAIKAELKEFSVRLHSKDTKEAINAFLEKRQPHFE
ncbi:MAG: enoyl-CoA hydratase/isomerase family protein [Legionellales bacterium]